MTIKGNSIEHTLILYW